MARQKVQVVLPSLCKKHGGGEEYPDLWVGELTGQKTDGGSCFVVKFSQKICMSIPKWLLRPVDTRVAH